MLKKIAITVVVLLALLLLYAATRPNTFRVQRTVRMKATPERLFANINDLHAWSAWSPWEKVDPAMKRTFSGPAGGVGAVYEWEGNSDVGAGRMEIIETTPPTKIVVKVDFLKPIAGHDTAEFTLEPKGDSTDVTWAMYGPSPYIGKLIGVFVSMDKMIGKNFDDGLASLKTGAEK